MRLFPEKQVWPSPLGDLPPRYVGDVRAGWRNLGYAVFVCTCWFAGMVIWRPVWDWEWQTFVKFIAW